MSAKKKKLTSQQYYVPAIIQKIVVYGIVSLYLLQAAISTVVYFTYPLELEASLSFYMLQLVPITFYAIAYALNPRKLSVLSRSFESLLLTMVGLLLWVVVQAAVHSSSWFIYNETNYLYLDIGVAITSLSVSSLILIFIRKRKIWN